MSTHEPTRPRRRLRWVVLVASSVAVVVLIRRMTSEPDELSQVRASGEGWGALPEAGDGEAIDPEG